MITTDDRNWLATNHPDLYFDPDIQVIRGEFYFEMYYSANESGYVLNPDDSYERKDGVIIQDAYEIEIDLLKQKFLPPVREVGGRILRSKEKWNIKRLIDMHVYSDGTACLCMPIEVQTKMPNGFNLKDFFENLLIPFFYYQSYFEKYGKEPWKGYSHGFLGVLESYLNWQHNLSTEIFEMFLAGLPDKITKYITNNCQVKGHHLCFCGSNKKFRICHKEALFGYNKLRTDYHKMKKLRNQ